MFSWLQKDIPVFASILYRGTWPCHKESFGHLRDKGITIEESPNEAAGWTLNLSHPEWGNADLFWIRNLPLPPEIIIDWSPDLTDAEKADVKACGNCVNLHVKSSRKHLLRDRKAALFFMDAIMAEEAVAALDHTSEKFWSREALRLEASHSADADVQALFTVHCVVEENNDGWLHSHGFGALGLADFDILNPDESMVEMGADAIRCIAHFILEGELGPGDSVKIDRKRESIHAVSVGDFLEKTDPRWTVFHKDNPDHRENRVVLCDPPRKGFWGLGRRGVQPSAVLMKPFEEGTLLSFTEDATQLMSARARQTYGFFRSCVQELAEYKFPALVKIGYRVDGGGPTDNEHLWFEVHEARETEVDATLLNQPFGVARLKEGARAIYPIENLTDWQMMTPAGPINPRQSLALRHIRHMIAEKKLSGEES
jgi:hypothetical protein